MSEVRIHIPEALATVAGKVAIRTRRTTNRVIEDAIIATLDQEEATSDGSDGEVFDSALLQIVVEHPFMVAMYDGRLAAVAVDIHESGKVVDSINVHGYAVQEKNRGTPPLVSWCSWFVAMCRRSGMDMARGWRHD